MADFLWQGCDQTPTSSSYPSTPQSSPARVARIYHEEHGRQVKLIVDLAALLGRDKSKLPKILKLADLDPLEVGKVMRDNSLQNSSR